MTTSSRVTELTMSSERPDVSTVNSSDERTETLPVPRWVVVVGLLVVSLPLLMMSFMMLVMGWMGWMGWMGPPMHGMMAGSDPGVFRVVGFVPLLLVLGVTYGGYRLSVADKR